MTERGRASAGQPAARAGGVPDERRSRAGRTSKRAARSSMSSSCSWAMRDWTSEPRPKQTMLVGRGNTGSSCRRLTRTARGVGEQAGQRHVRRCEQGTTKPAWTRTFPGLGPRAVLEQLAPALDGVPDLADLGCLVVGLPVGVDSGGGLSCGWPALAALARLGRLHGRLVLDLGRDLGEAVGVDFVRTCWHGRVNLPERAKGVEGRDGRCRLALGRSELRARP